MTVTDPDVPDPLNDPRTLQADPGAVAEGDDLASTEDDATATGEDELPTSATEADEAGGGDLTGDAFTGSPAEAPTADRT
ncbi:hypothetical protein SAMN05661080_03477 [Modestobacter sp. DSM 44400]|uniref:hypothetical protein n=1 Tax=Modestobacter sp. DSM 44400 TaxID=1550230 RepID=UPI000898754B|nr:hypothetical protein [Modestobacter sp. DSM 44400]SDY44132.1 hypothetical protein SAMN05661080_03477 [Modestobacter sp. DSM 44400]